MVFFQFNFAQILLIFIWFALSMRVSVCTITRKETREHPSTKFNCNQQKSHKPWIPISNPQILWSRVIARLSVIQYHFLFPFLLLINPFISYHFCAWSLRFCKKKILESNTNVYISHSNLWPTELPVDFDFSSFPLMKIFDGVIIHNFDLFILNASHGSIITTVFNEFKHVTVGKMNTPKYT